jgi:hypothetical protein
VSRLYVGGHAVGEFRSGPGVGQWLELAVDVPADVMTDAVVTLREQFVGSGGDVNAFQFRIYQRERP